MFHVNRGLHKPQKHKINDDILEISPLGAGSEVGRSSILLKYKGKQVLFDCGVHPAFKGTESLPYFDLCRPEEVDLLLVSHFHLDHCGAIPHFLMHTKYEGPCFMTHPTKAIVSLLLKDFVRVSDDNQTLEMADRLFTEDDLVNMEKRVFGIDYRQEKKVNGVKFWCYNAGHVLGAAMFMVEIAGVHVLYTGDFSPIPDRHLVGAEIPTINPQILLVESTYGTGVHESREQRELRFMRMVKQIVEREGKCLVPVFALGRAQELLLILDEMWHRTPSLRDSVPIYYASSLAEKCMSIFLTYSNTMNDEVRNEIDYYNRNPFKFKHIKKLRKANEVKNKLGPCVVLASPGMLQSGLSRELYETWCSDPKNGVVITGYCVDDTPARIIQNEPNNVILSTGEEVPFRMTVNTISFSAHSDRKMTEEFIEKISPDSIVLIHGSSKSVKKLRGALNTKFPSTPVYHPKNGDNVMIEFKREKVGKMIGTLAEKFRDHNRKWRVDHGKLEDEWREDDVAEDGEATANAVGEIFDGGVEEDEDAMVDDEQSREGPAKSSDEAGGLSFVAPKAKKVSWKELMERTRKRKEEEEKKKKMEKMENLKEEEEEEEKEDKMVDEEEEEDERDVPIEKIEELEDGDEMQMKDEEETQQPKEEKEEEEEEETNISGYYMNPVPVEKRKNREISGIYLSKDFQTHLIDPADLTKYFKIPMSNLSQKMILQYPKPDIWNMEKKSEFFEFWVAEFFKICGGLGRQGNLESFNYFGGGEEEMKLDEYLLFGIDLNKLGGVDNSSEVHDHDIETSKKKSVQLVEDRRVVFRIDRKKVGQIEVTWNSSRTTDFIVDYVAMELLSQFSMNSNSSVKRERDGETEEEGNDFTVALEKRQEILGMGKNGHFVLEKLKDVLGEFFGEGMVVIENGYLVVRERGLDSVTMKVNSKGLFCGDCVMLQEEKERIRKVIDRVFLTFDPLYHLKMKEMV